MSRSRSTRTEPRSRWLQTLLSWNGRYVVAEAVEFAKARGLASNLVVLERTLCREQARRDAEQDRIELQTLLSWNGRYVGRRNRQVRRCSMTLQTLLSWNGRYVISPSAAAAATKTLLQTLLSWNGRYVPTSDGLVSSVLIDVRCE